MERISTATIQHLYEYEHTVSHMLYPNDNILSNQRVQIAFALNRSNISGKQNSIGMKFSSLCDREFVQFRMRHHTAELIFEEKLNSHCY